MLFNRSKEVKPKDISYEELTNLMKVDHCLVDSRGRSSYAKFHIDGAINIPYEEFTELSHLLPDSTDTPLIFYCKNVYCILSPNSAQKAISLGYRNVYVYKGGVEEWITKNGIQLPQIDEPGKLTREQFIEIYKRKDDEYVIIDVNDTYDYKIKHLKGAVNFPYGYIITNYNKLPKNKKLIFYCASGARGEDIYYFLKEKGIFKEGEIFFLAASVIFDGDKAKII